MAVRISVYGTADMRQIERARGELDKLAAAARRNQPGFSGAVYRMGESMQRAGAQMTSVGMGMTKNVTLPIVAAGVGLAKLTVAAAEDSKAQAILAKTLENTTGATDKAVAATEGWISKQGELLGVTDDQLRPALATLATATGSVTKAQELATLSMDIAAAKGIDVEAASKAVAKAYDGNTGALKKLLPGIDSAVLASGDFAAIQAEVASIVGGQAATAADTAAGRMQRIKVAVSEAGEALGTAFLPIMETVMKLMTDKVVPAIQRVAEWFGKLSPGVKTAIVVIAGIAAAIGPVLVVLGSLTTGIGAVAKVLPLVGKALTTGLGPLGLIIGAIAAVIALSPELRELFGNVLGNLVKQLAPVFEKLGTAMVPVIKLLGESLGQVVTMLAPVFTQLVSAIAPIIPIIGGVLAKVLMTIVPIFLSLIKAVLPIVPIIGGLLASALKMLAPLFMQIVQALMPLIPAVMSLLPPIMSLLKPLMGLVMSLLPPLIGLFKTLAPVIVTILGAAIKIVIPIIQTVVKVIATIITILAKVIAFVAPFIAKWLGFLGKFGAAVATAIGKVVAFFAGLLTKVVKAIGDAGAWLVGIGGDIVDGLLNGIKGAWDGLTGWLEDAVGNVVDGVKDMLGIASPSRVFAGIGENVGLGLERGIVSTMGRVAKAATGIAAAASVTASISTGMGIEANAAALSGPIAAPTSSAAQSITIAPGAVQIVINGNADSAAVGDSVDEALRKLVRELRSR